MMPVHATHADDLHEFKTGASRVPGAFAINEEGTYILCVCPCGCGHFLNLPICTGEKTDRNWLWDGNRETPTLSPSIRDVGTCFFHGHLQQGVWTFEGDSGRKP